MNKTFFVHFATDALAAIPPLNEWREIYADNHTNAAMKALQGHVPFNGSLFAHVHGKMEPKHENGMPMICRTLELRIV